MIKVVILLGILLKSTLTSFAGLASLPEIRTELVEQRHWLSDDDLNQAVVISRMTPGPAGVYVVSVGYLVGGIPGAVAGWIAMAAPSLMVILLVGYFGRRAQHPRVRSMLQCVVLASAALLVLAAVPIGREALDGPLPLAIAAVALPLLVAKRVNSLWIIGCAAALSFTGSLVGVTQMRYHKPILLDDRSDTGQVSSVDVVTCVVACEGSRGGGDHVERIERSRDGGDGGRGDRAWIGMRRLPGRWAYK